MMTNEIDESLPVACQPNAVPAAERTRWLELGKETYAAVEEIQELPDGYGLRLSPDRLCLVAEYVSRDRHCCSFLRWELVLEQAGGPLWLLLRGPLGTKAFVRAALESTALLRPEVMSAAGFGLGERPADAVDALTSHGRAETTGSARRRA
jgi:hypothetical protein